MATRAGDAHVVRVESGSNGRWLAVLALAWMAGCTPRPVNRRLGAIGAPAHGVMTNSDPNRSALTPERLQALARDRAIANARWKFSLRGTILEAADGMVSLLEPSGRRVDLSIARLTTVSMDGRPIPPRSLVPGSSVRARFVRFHGHDLAESIEVVRVPAQLEAEGRRLRSRGLRARPGRHVR